MSLSAALGASIQNSEGSTKQYLSGGIVKKLQPPTDKSYLEKGGVTGEIMNDATKQGVKNIHEAAIISYDTYSILMKWGLILLIGVGLYFGWKYRKSLLG